MLDSPVSTVSLGLDGTTIFLREQGYRIAMVGTVALYDGAGERLHTTYNRASSEYDMASLLERMTREIEHVTQRYPHALFIGLADGVTDNWSFLNRHTAIQVTDFWHASEYLAQPGVHRQEFEYEIPVSEAHALLDALCERPLIEKVRNFVTHANKTWEVDEFRGDNDGLVVAEVELSAVDETFERPDWVSEEVSDDPRYYNVNLVKTPYNTW